MNLELRQNKQIAYELPISAAKEEREARIRPPYDRRLMYR